jgi:hypothetical protein
VVVERVEGAHQRLHDQEIDGPVQGRQGGVHAASFRHK